MIQEGEDCPKAEIPSMVGSSPDTSEEAMDTEEQQDQVRDRHRAPELPQEGDGGVELHEGRDDTGLGRLRAGAGLLLQADRPVGVGAPPRALLRGALEQEGQEGAAVRADVREV